MNTSSQYSLVVMGASAGALEVLSTILPALPANYPLPILLVVHVPPDKDNAFPDLLKRKCHLDVREAEDKEPIGKGTIYMAPPDYHMLVEPDRRVSLSSEEPVLFSRPSIDILFETAAEVYGNELIGVILSGANEDGARGLKSISAAGGLALVQKPETAQASMMPEMALKVCPQALSLTLTEISTRLKEAGIHG